MRHSTDGRPGESVRPRTSGFTLVELLVVIAVIGILVALLMPAVQQSREAARRTQCRSRLHQLSLAIHNYEDTHRTYPIGAITVGPSFRPMSGWGWGAMLLPYLDQAPLYQSIDFSTRTAVGPNRALIESTLPVWVCTSDPAPGAIELTSPDGPLRVGTGNYCGVESVFRSMECFRPRDVTDGLSQTLFVGERVYQPSRSGSPTYTSSWCGHVTDSTATLPNSIPHLPISPDRPPNSSPFDVNAFTSYHPGSVHFAMGDGAVRSIIDSIDISVYVALGTRDGGEVIEF